MHQVSRQSGCAVLVNEWGVRECEVLVPTWGPLLPHPIWADCSSPRYPSPLFLWNSQRGTESTSPGTAVMMTPCKMFEVSGMKGMGSVIGFVHPRQVSHLNFSKMTPLDIFRCEGKPHGLEQSSGKQTGSWWATTAKTPCLAEPGKRLFWHCCV